MRVVLYSRSVLLFMNVCGWRACVWGGRRITALTLGPGRAPSPLCTHPVSEAAYKGARRFEKRFVKRGVSDGG